jgi:acylphosphatase
VSGADDALEFVVRGRVQGVGFRAWARDEAQSLGLTGWVRNEPDGSVRLRARGPDAALSRFDSALRRGPRFARVTSVEKGPAEHNQNSGFVILR